MLKTIDTTNSRLLTDASDERTEETLCETLTLWFCSQEKEQEFEDGHRRSPAYMGHSCISDNPNFFVVIDRSKLSMKSRPLSFKPGFYLTQRMQSKAVAHFFSLRQATQEKYPRKYATNARVAADTNDAAA